MTASEPSPVSTLKQTPASIWDITAKDIALVAGTIREPAREYLLRKAQNLPIGSYPTVEAARRAPEEDPA